MRLLAGVVLALALAGCGGSTGSHVTAPPPATAPLTPSATPTPSPTVLSVKQAAAAYLALVRRGNADVNRANKILVGHAPPLATDRYWGHRLQRDFSREAVLLRSTLWPANARLVAAKMADAESAVIAQLQGMTMATSSNEAVDAWNGLDFRKSTTYAEQMRELLGLPPA